MISLIGSSILISADLHFYFHKKGATAGRFIKIQAASTRLLIIIKKVISIIESPLLWQ